MREVLVAELDSPERAIAVAWRARELGYVHIEAYTPFPIADLDVALDAMFGDDADDLLT